MRRCLVDTAVFIYADGRSHPYRKPCQELVRRVAERVLEIEASVDLLHEYVSVQLRSGRDRGEVVERARRIGALCRLHDVERRDIARMLDLLGRPTRLDPRDAVFAATALNRGIDAIVASDRAFDAVPGLERIDPADTARIDELS